jgi:hypothetical protein
MQSSHPLPIHGPINRPVDNTGSYEISKLAKKIASTVGRTATAT